MEPIVCDDGVHLSFALDKSKLVDLTHSFDQSAIYWPNAEAFHWEKERWGKTQEGTWYAAGRYAASEHGVPISTVLFISRKAKRLWTRSHFPTSLVLPSLWT